MAIVRSCAVIATEGELFSCFLPNLEDSLLVIFVPFLLASVLVSLVSSAVRSEVSVSEDESSVEFELVRENELLLVLLDVSDCSDLSNLALFALLLFFSARTRFLRRSKLATSFSVSFLMERLWIGDDRLERVRFLDLAIPKVSLLEGLAAGDLLALMVSLWE